MRQRIATVMRREVSSLIPDCQLHCWGRGLTYLISRLCLCTQRSICFYRLSSSQSIAYSTRDILDCQYANNMGKEEPTPPPSPPPTSVPAFRNILPLSLNPKTSSTSSSSPPGVCSNLTPHLCISQIPNRSRYPIIDLVDNKISCRFDGVGPVGCRKECKLGWEFLFKKGERRDDRNDDRVEGGGGESRIDVRRMGRSRFEETFLISFTLSMKV
jgi:hypothetical protein